MLVHVSSREKQAGNYNIRIFLRFTSSICRYFFVPEGIKYLNWRSLFASDYGRSPNAGPRVNLDKDKFHMDFSEKSPQKISTMISTGLTQIFSYMLCAKKIDFATKNFSYATLLRRKSYSFYGICCSAGGVNRYNEK